MKDKRIVVDLPYDVDVIENKWIELSDGVKLSARLWLPKLKDNEKLPAILEYIPYRKTDGTRARDEPMHGYFSGHGYNVIRVDMRGSGESDGLLKGEYHKQEQDDALEVIKWIASQPWCDGNVGMMGKSWGGFNSLQVAARQPESLKAIICVGFTDDRYNCDIHYKGGCLLNDNFWWGAIMLAYQVRPIDPNIVGTRWRKDWLKRVEDMPLWMADWTKHQTRDDYWKHGSVCEDYSQIQVPVMAVDGWEDAYSNTVLSLLENINVAKKGFIGPWAHVYPQDGTPVPAIGFLQEAVRWWDKWLKNIDNDVMEDKMLQIWMEDSMQPNSIKPQSFGKWVGLNNWPSNDVKDKIYGLSECKLVDKNNKKEEIIEIKTPLNHGLFGGEHMGAGVYGETATDQRYDDGMTTFFESEILENDTEILGYPEFNVSLSSDKERAMLFVQLSDVAPCGSVTRVSYGVMNLTHLQGHDQVVLLDPNSSYIVNVKLDACARNFKQGHKLRVSLATTFWPMFWPMPEEATLLLDLSTAKFKLPLFKGEKINGPNDQPETASLTPITLLKEGSVDRNINYDFLSDTWTYTVDGVGGVFGEGIYRFDEVDVMVEHNLLKEMILTNNDPLSAKHKITQKMKIGREGWLIDADIVVSMHCDFNNFYFKGSMDIKENNKQVFTKEWDEVIKRNGL